jgi:hypothetical protein
MFETLRTYKVDTDDKLRFGAAFTSYLRHTWRPVLLRRGSRGSAVVWWWCAILLSSAVLSRWWLWRISRRTTLLGRVAHGLLLGRVSTRCAGVDGRQWARRTAMLLLRGPKPARLRKRVRGRAAQGVLLRIHWERGAAGVLRRERRGSLAAGGGGATRCAVGIAC